MNRRLPRRKFKKAFSSSKKACPKKMPFIMKNAMEAAVPIIGEEVKLRLR